MVKVTLEYSGVIVQTVLPDSKTEALIDYLAEEGIGELHRVIRSREKDKVVAA